MPKIFAMTSKLRNATLCINGRRITTAYCIQPFRPLSYCYFRNEVYTNNIMNILFMLQNVCGLHFNGLAYKIDID